MKILITGGCGFIGTNLIEYLHYCIPTCKILNLDAKTSISNNHLFDNYGNSNWYTECVIDISHDAFISDEYFPHDFSCIIHCAAESHVDRSCESIDKFIYSNIIGTKNIAEFAIKYNIPMINISTDEVYGHLTNTKNFGFNENTPIAPRNPYAATKASANMIIDALSNKYPNWKVLTTFCGNNYGKFQDNTKFIPVIINNILNNKKIPVYGDGKFYRSWINVLDHCDAIYILMNSLINGTNKHNKYNIGAGNCFSNIDIIKLICNKLNVDYNNFVNFIEDPRGKCHDKIYKINYSRFKKEFNWKPKYTYIHNTNIKNIKNMNIYEVITYYKKLK